MAIPFWIPKGGRNRKKWKCCRGVRDKDRMLQGVKHFKAYTGVRNDSRTNVGVKLPDLVYGRFRQVSFNDNGISCPIFSSQNVTWHVIPLRYSNINPFILGVKGNPFPWWKTEEKLNKTRALTNICSFLWFSSLEVFLFCHGLKLWFPFYSE